MPIYEFRCQRCEGRFEELVDAGTDSATCPSCGAEETRRVFSPQGAPFKIVKTPGEARRQERRNAQLRERTKQAFKARRRRSSRQGRGAG